MNDKQDSWEHQYFEAALAGPVPEGLLDWLNRIEDRRRLRRYNRIKDDTTRRARLVIEGDSWLCHPTETEIYDVLHRDYRYRIRSLAAAGDLLTDMILQGQMADAIREESPAAFVLSGGGNDVVTEMATLLNDWDGDVSNIVNEQEFLGFISVLKANILNMFRVVQNAKPGLPMLFHGYDYGDPGNPYFGLLYFGLADALQTRKVPERHWKAAMRVFLDRVNIELQTLEKPPLYFLDLRGTVADDEWIDELHADDDGIDNAGGKSARKARFHSMSVKSRV